MLCYLLGSIKQDWGFVTSFSKHSPPCFSSAKTLTLSTPAPPKKTIRQRMLIIIVAKLYIFSNQSNKKLPWKACTPLVISLAVKKIPLKLLTLFRPLGASLVQTIVPLASLLLLSHLLWPFLAILLQLLFTCADTPRAHGIFCQITPNRHADQDYCKRCAVICLICC